MELRRYFGAAIFRPKIRVLKSLGRCHGLAPGSFTFAATRRKSKIIFCAQLRGAEMVRSKLVLLNSAPHNCAQKVFFGLCSCERETPRGKSVVSATVALEAGLKHIEPCLNGPASLIPEDVIAATCSTTSSLTPNAQFAHDRPLCSK
jgi:hypothetical protein